MKQYHKYDPVKIANAYNKKNKTAYGHNYLNRVLTGANFNAVGFKKRLSDFTKNKDGSVAKKFLELDFSFIALEATKRMNKTGQPFRPSYCKRVYVGEYASKELLRVINEIIKE